MEAGLGVSQMVAGVMVTTQEDFSRWLKEKMRERGMNYALLAKEAGITPSNVRNWEVGANLPTWHRCLNLALALGLPVDEVRRMAGYIDPGDEAKPDEGMQELAAMWPDFDDTDRQAMLHTARAIHNYRRLVRGAQS